MNYPTFTLIAAIALASPAIAQNADNSATNARDRGGQTLTPINQSNDPADLKLAAAIRKMVVDDGSLSANAKNVKIITVSGVVTLRGPVENETEKATIEKHAKMAGASSVVNQLEIKQP